MALNGVYSKPSFKEGTKVLIKKSEPFKKQILLHFESSSTGFASFQRAKETK